MAADDHCRHVSTSSSSQSAAAAATAAVGAADQYQDGGLLLTTIEQLPATIKSQYSSYTQRLHHHRSDNSRAASGDAGGFDAPLDLTVKSDLMLGMTPPSTPSPPKKRYRDWTSPVDTDTNFININTSITSITSIATTINFETTTVPSAEVISMEKQRTPNSKPIIANQSEQRLKSAKTLVESRPAKRQKRTKATRKLKFDEHSSSPVSGTIIRRLEEIGDDDQIGDIDPEYNVVEVTDEAKAEIAAIVNVIGDYVCQLCRKYFDDAFELASHRCSCIVLLEYRCPECGKRFNCPANLASHRRWHKPRDQNARIPRNSTKASSNAAGGNGMDKLSCSDCNKTFKRLAYLKKHQASHAAVSRGRQYTEGQRPATPPRSGISNTDDDHESYDLREVDETEGRSLNPSKLHAFTQIVFQYAGDTAFSSTSDLSMCSSMSPIPSSKHKIPLTEDENLAAAALAHLRHGSSVIRHTTLSV